MRRNVTQCVPAVLMTRTLPQHRRDALCHILPRYFFGSASKAFSTSSACLSVEALSWFQTHLPP